MPSQKMCLVINYFLVGIFIFISLSLHLFGSSMEKVEHGIWISLSLGVPTHEQSHSQDLMIEPLKEFFNHGPFNLDHAPHLARLSRLLDIQ
jgi:hypothetical protein